VALDDGLQLHMGVAVVKKCDLTCG